MPHQCVRCGTLYEDGSNELLKGCNCGARLFFFIKKDKLKEIQEKTAKLTDKEKEQIEKDVFDLVGSEIDANEPVILDLESIRVLKPGKYCVIVIGNATIQGEELKTVEMTVNHLKNLGFSLEKNMDKIIFGLYNVMLKENILIFRKK